MKQLVTLKSFAVLFCMMFVLSVNAQTTVTWPLQSTRTPDVTSGTGWTAANQVIMNGDITPTPALVYLKHNSYLAGKAVGGLNAAQRVSAYTQTSTFLTYNANYYIEYSVTPVSGYKLNVSDVSFDIGSASTDNGKAAFYYSTDNFSTQTVIGGYSNTSPLSVGRLTSDLLTVANQYSFSSLGVSNADSFKFRIYLWVTSNSTSARNFTHSNMKITFTANEVVGCVDAIVSNPSATQICENGGTASMSVVGGGSAPVYQWEYSPDNGVTTWSNVVDGTSANITFSGATSNSLGFTASSGAQNGYYRCIVTSTCSGNTTTATSQSALLTVNQPSVAGTAVASAAAVAWGQSGAVTLSGHTGNVQWQQSAEFGTNWTDISGATSAVLTTPAITAKTYYRAKISSGVCSSVYSNVDSVSVSSFPDAGANRTWNFSALDGSSNLIWNDWLTISGNNRMQNGLVIYANAAKTLGVTASSSAPYTHRVKFDKSVPTFDVNGKPVFYAIGFPVSNKGTLTIALTSGSNTADGSVKLYHYNVDNTPRTSELAMLTSPMTVPQVNDTLTYYYNGSMGAGEIIIAQATAAQGTNILEMNWTPDLSTSLEDAFKKSDFSVINKMIYFKNNVTAEVYTLNGSKLIEINDRNFLNLSGFNPGCYLLRINKNSNSITYKLLF